MDFESREIRDNGERITGCKWRHSFDCAVLVFGGRRRRLNAEGAEEVRPSASFREAEDTENSGAGTDPAVADRPCGCYGD